METKIYRSRFAPSPTGYLHLGHVASAYYVWQAASQSSGEVLLRIEDIDRGRCRPEFEAAIIEDLEWLGFEWPLPIRRQSDHFKDYEACLNALQAKDLIYRCFKTRREISAALPAGSNLESAPYRGKPLSASEEEERLSRGHAFAWRLNLRAAIETLGSRYDTLHYFEKKENKTTRVKSDPTLFGDVILARKDTPTSYHLACCHDDALQGMTHIVRGEDLRAVTGLHTLLQALLGWPTPLYRFHPLLFKPDGRKLSKSAGDPSIRDLREQGLTPDQIKVMALSR
ncbi:MAG: tRNA glutamyl-Q(34) synthetase GluQRS [Hyphomonas sp.]